MKEKTQHQTKDKQNDMIGFLQKIECLFDVTLRTWKTDLIDF